MLDTVHALRFASTPPLGGASGHGRRLRAARRWAVARWDFRMASNLRRRTGIDVGFHRAYVDTSRLCRSAHPPLRTQCMWRAILTVAHTARPKRTPRHRGRFYARALSVARVHPNREPRDSSPRIVSRTKRSQERHFEGASLRPLHRGETRAIVRRRSRGSMSATSPHPRSTDLGAPATRRRAGARIPHTRTHANRVAGGAP